MLGYSEHMRYSFFALFLTAQLLWAQNPSAGLQQDEILSLVGIRLDDLVTRFGLPHSVRSQRGEEPWQDDVVFVYNEGDFYIYQDRVWQIGLRSAYGMSIGDSSVVALLIFGEGVQDSGGHHIYQLPGAQWPLSLRVNINDGRISGIFIFRQDF